MQFEKGHLYHIYNQGNNRRKIFFERENYLFFLKKIRTHILPYADVLAWCLMPNHFHLMVVVREVEVRVSGESKGLASSETLALKRNRTLNQSIGILLRSYTNAINNQEKTSGSLFRKQTKAECIDCINELTPSFINEDGITQIHISNPRNQYPQRCFNYIHNNPVKAKMVSKARNYEFSSAMDYFGERDGNLINKEIAAKYVNY